MFNKHFGDRNVLMEMSKISRVLQMIASYHWKDITLHSHLGSSLELRHIASCCCCVQHADKGLNDISIVCHVPELYVDFLEI